MIGIIAASGRANAFAPQLYLRSKTEPHPVAIVKHAILISFSYFVYYHI